LTLFTIGEKFCKFVNFTRPFCEKSELEGLDNYGKKPKKPILAQQFPVFAAAGVAQQQLRENCCGRGRKSPP
jgi:hypothetical protein